ncbi:oligosaccharide flippase family protein [Planococcus sp. MERTA32b]|nr:oligosaccharide flippase family protein [Planococcus sp. MER TA 32b]
MNLLKKLFSFSIGSTLGLLIGLVSTPIITRIIEPAEFGIAAIFMTVSSVLGILALAGIDQVFIRFFYESDRLDLLRKCLFFCIGSMGVCIAAIILFGEPLSTYISPDDNYVILLTINVVVMVLFRFSLLILRMLQFGYRYSLIQVLQRLLDLLFVLSFAFIFFPNRYALIFSSILASFILSIVSLFMARSFWDPADEVRKKISFKPVMSYSLPLLLAALMTVLFQTLDKLFLNAWVTSAEFGIYAAAFKLVAILNVIQTSFTLFWAPASLEHYQQNPEDKEFYSRISKMITVTMISVCILVVLTKDILVLFLGEAYREASSVIALLVLMPAMYTMSETTVQGVVFSLKSYLHIVVSGIALTANILLCWWLIPLFGMEGASLSIALSYIVFYLSRTYFGMKHFYFDVKLLRTLLLIFCLLIWVIAVVFLDNQIILFAGGAGMFALLLFLFAEEVLDGRNFVRQMLNKKA